jgi:acyl carrier protein
MTPEQIREAVVRIIGEVAPELEPEQFRPDLPWRDQIDIDSIDFLNVLLGIERELSVTINEAEYPKIRTLNELIDYIAQKQMTGR